MKRLSIVLLSTMLLSVMCLSFMRSSYKVDQIVSDNIDALSKSACVYVYHEYWRRGTPEQSNWVKKGGSSECEWYDWTTEHYEYRECWELVWIILDE